MAKPKETKRLQRDALIKLLEEEQDQKLEDLIEVVKEKHENGGLIKDLSHYKKTQICIQALTEEELDG